MQLTAWHSAWNLAGALLVWSIDCSSGEGFLKEVKLELMRVWGSIL